MRVIVAGGRDFDDPVFVWEQMTRLHNKYGPFTEVVHGGAKGADGLAADWAVVHGIPVLAVHANWKKYGRAAGPIRNAKMLRDYPPGMVITFPGGRGTANLRKLAKAARYKVVSLEKRYAKNRTAKNSR